MTAGNSAEWLGEWKATDITFRARSQAEAQKKADKFWRDAQLGFGSMVCIPADETLCVSDTTSRVSVSDSSAT